MKPIIGLAALLMMAAPAIAAPTCEGSTPVLLISKEQECALVGCRDGTTDCAPCWHWYVCVAEGDKRLTNQRLNWIRQKLEKSAKALRCSVTIFIRK